MTTIEYHQDAPAATLTREQQLAADIIERIQQEGCLTKAQATEVLGQTLPNVFQVNSASNGAMVSALVNRDHSALSPEGDKNVHRIIMHLCGDQMEY